MFSRGAVLEYHYYPLLIGISIFITPVAFAWAARTPLSIRTALAFWSIAAAVLFALWKPLGEFGPASQADPLGLRKYLLGAVLLASVFAWLSWSFARAKRDTTRAKGWCFRATLVFLVLTSVWVKIQLFFGDEPQYLMQAASLANDGGLAFDDEYLRGAYHEFLHVTMSDTQYLAGWNVNLSDPPSRTQHFSGASAILAPLYRILRGFHLPPYIFRLLLGTPFLILTAAALARACRYLSEEREDDRWGMGLCFLFLFATPVHIWAQTFSPEPVLLFLLTFAAVELVRPQGKTIRWTMLALALMPWMHPRTFAFVSLLLLWTAAVRPVRNTVGAVLLATLSFSMKVGVDAYTRSGLFAGYGEYAATFVKYTPGRFIVSGLSHWISADAGYLFFAPLALCILFALPALLLTPGLCREKRAAAWFLASCVAFGGIHSISDHVNGIGRFAFWWLPFGLALALSVGHARRSAAVATLVAGGFWNFVLTEFTLVQSRMPSAGLRMLGIDLAWLAPQLTRRSNLRIDRGIGWEILLSAIWIAAIFFLYKITWKRSGEMPLTSGENSDA